MNTPKASEAGNSKLSARAARRARKQSSDESALSFQAATSAGPVSKTLLAGICIVLGIVTLAVYLQTATFGFVAYDDDQYVYENPTVLAGLTPTGIAWAFTTFFYANWHPLTWLSLMLDSNLFGSGAGGRHVVNVLLHVGSSLLLFLALVRMTRNIFPSAFVAGVFALHPLHVESVAWVSERKDVLSTVCGALALLLYSFYLEQPTRKRYLWMALAFGASLLAKPMLVTLPFVLILLDFWPLHRIDWPPAWPTLKSLLLEKMPLLVMSAMASVLTFIAQKSYGSVIAIERLNVSTRIGNAAIGYLTYLAKFFMPARLAMLYPYEIPSPGSVVAALAVLIIVTAICLLTARRRPYLLVGWLWYLGTLVPVIGIVQVGIQSIADRYTYIPLVGISIAIAWGVTDFAGNSELLRRGGVILGGVLLLVLAADTYAEASYWKDSRTAFERTLVTTKNNAIIHNNLGVILVREGKIDEALRHYREALAVDPVYADAHANFGHALLVKGGFEEAFGQLSEALRLKPDLSMTHEDMGVLLVAQGNLNAALPHFTEAARLSPSKPDGHSNLCYVLQRIGRQNEAIEECGEALRQNPDFLDARFNLGTALASAGRKAEAIQALSAVLKAKPDHAGARAALQQLQLEPAVPR